MAQPHAVEQQPPREGVDQDVDRGADAPGRGLKPGGETAAAAELAALHPSPGVNLTVGKAAGAADEPARSDGSPMFRHYQRVKRMYCGALAATALYGMLASLAFAGEECGTTRGAFALFLAACGVEAAHVAFGDIGETQVEENCAVCMRGTWTLLLAVARYGLFVACMVVWAIDLFGTQDAGGFTAAAFVVCVVSHELLYSLTYAWRVPLGDGCACSGDARDKGHYIAKQWLTFAGSLTAFKMYRIDHEQRTFVKVYQGCAAQGTSETATTRTAVTVVQGTKYTGDGPAHDALFTKWERAVLAVHCVSYVVLGACLLDL